MIENLVTVMDTEWSVDVAGDMVETFKKHVSRYKIYYFLQKKQSRKNKVGKGEGAKGGKGIKGRGGGRGERGRGKRSGPLFNFLVESLIIPTLDLKDTALNRSRSFLNTRFMDPFSKC